MTSFVDCSTVMKPTHRDLNGLDSSQPRTTALSLVDENVDGRGNPRRSQLRAATGRLRRSGCENPRCGTVLRLSFRPRHYIAVDIFGGADTCSVGGFSGISGFRDPPFMNPADSGTNETDSYSSDQRQHTGLRTVEPHYTAREVTRALHCQYGTGVLREKAHLRAEVSTERAQSPDTGGGTTAAQDRRGERRVSL